MAIRKRVPYVLAIALAVGLLYMVLTPYKARGVADWYASASGSGTTCSIGSPCSLHTLLTGGMAGEAAGDHFWVRGGTYTTDASTNRWLWTGIDCTAIAPCDVRNYNNEHAILDCNADLSAANINGACLATNNATGKYVRFWGLDVKNTSTQSRLSPNEAANDPPTTMGEIQLIAEGSSLINSWVRDQNNGVVKQATFNGVNQSKNTIYGNYFQYEGYWGALRSYGHSGYLKNAVGEANRSTYEANVGLRSWQVGVQLYSDSQNLATMTIKDNVEAASGHGSSPTVAWPAKGNWNQWYLGASGGVATSCTDGRIVRQLIFDGNQSWGANTLAYGGSKGSCDVTFTNNRLLQSNGIMTMTNGATYVPQTFTGNYFYGTPDGSGGPAPLFTSANYGASNTIAASIPTIGSDVFKYSANAYETGRGWVAVWSPTGASTVTIDPAQMGCYAGEAVRIFNWQDNNPWDSTPIATQTGCGTLSVSTTIAAGSITQPGFTTDGVGTLFPKPADLGPNYVVYFLYPDWSAVTTPTPTNTQTFTPSRTPSNTPTRTFTPSFTSTATFTPSQTPTQSVTPSQSPTASPTFTVTPSVTQTRTVTNTPTSTPTPAGTFTSTSFDIQSCTLAAPMVTGVDANTFGGLEVHSTVADSVNPIDGASGTATCTFNIATAGKYRTWIRLKTDVPQADSMYVAFDGEAVTATTHVFDGGESYACASQSIPDEYESWWNQSWTWVTLKERSPNNCKGTTTVPGYERADTPGATEGVTLSAGTHTIQFINREISGGTSMLLDYVIITNDFGFTPSDFALTPTPTPGPICHFDLCNGRGKMHCAPRHAKSQCPWPR